MKFSEWYELREEKDACYHKVKSRYRVWPSAYACVPEKTSKALTKEGWKFYKELVLGEEILTYNLYNDYLEFKPIQNLYYYENADTWVIKNGNTGWKFECTPNHKWVVKHPKCDGSRGREKYNDMINDMRLATLEELLKGSGSNRKLVISSKYYGGKPVSLEKIYKYQTNWIEYLINCSPEQRESWLYSAIIYDGNQIKTQRLVKQTNESSHEYLYDTPYGKQSFGFKQKDINHRDAFLLAAFLNKGLVTFKKVKNKDIFNCHYIAYNGTKSFENFKIIEERNTTVWCPKTENNTWVMMQETDGNGIISITGNSGALVKCRKVGAANWGNSKNKKHKKKKHMLEESLKDPKQYSDAANAAMALHYKGIDPATSSSEEIIKALISMGKNPPEDTSMELFAARIKSVAKGNVDPEDFKKETFDVSAESKPRMQLSSIDKKNISIEIKKFFGNNPKIVDMHLIGSSSLSEKEKIAHDMAKYGRMRSDLERDKDVLVKVSGIGEEDIERWSFSKEAQKLEDLYGLDVQVTVANASSLEESIFNLEKEKGLHGWFSRKTGGWIDCKASKKGHLVSCGRKKAGKGAERAYPACRPTLSACNKKGLRRKKSSKPISWK